MAGTYLDVIGGVPTQKNAKGTSAGAGDAGELVKLNSSGKVDATMMPPETGLQVRTITTSEALSAGNLINIHNSSGEKVRKADATTPGKEADGYVLASASSGAPVVVYTEEGIISGLTGLTPGTQMFLDTTAGAANATAPSGSGNVVQSIGKAVSATEILFRPQQPITLA